MRVPWPLRDGWRWMLLGDLVDFRTQQVDPATVDGDIHYVGLEHISKDIGEVAPVTVADGDTASRKHAFDERAILYGKLRPYLNKVATPNFAGLCSTDIIPIEPRPGMDRRYLALYLRGREFVRTTTLRSRGDLPRVGIRTLGQIPIPVPPPSEQQRCIEMLELADEAIRRARHAHRQTEELARRVYRSIVGPAHPAYATWVRKRIRDLATPEPGSIRTGPFGSTLRHSEFVRDGVAVLGIDNAVQNRFAWGERRYISERKYAELRRYTVKPGDVIVTIMGTTGRAAVVPDDIPSAISTKHLATITPDRTQIEPEFLAGAIQYDSAVRSQVPSNRGAIMDGLNLGIVKDLLIAVPPIDLQRRFVEAMRAIFILVGRL
jgi:type I restriction enzyme, S subunit